jgi:hypothetical protein
MACAVASVISKLPQTLGMEFMWKIRSMYEKVFQAYKRLESRKIFEA